MHKVFAGKERDIEEILNSQTTRNFNKVYHYPRVPLVEVYDWCIDNTFVKDQIANNSFWSRAKECCGIFPSYIVKDFEQTVVLEPKMGENVCVKILEGFFKTQKRVIHLGLVQIAIRPLRRERFSNVPIKVGLTDKSHPIFGDSILALVETNLSQGPFHFNCFPDSFYNLQDPSQSVDALKLYVMTSWIPLVLSYRVVCEVLEHPTYKFSNRVSGETTYIQTAIPKTTKWDQVELPYRWIENYFGFYDC
ncbi:uncharacterized protein LOC130800459 isoform X3 [Amaranthus tricolor]|nr:uncharacterized protein LOC130800459 isoform X3 [Amaranthus tricolor]